MMPDVQQIYANSSRRPFLRIDNHCVPLHRITNINFIPNGLISKVGDTVWYDEDLAEQDAQERKTLPYPVTVPIVIIDYINKDGDLDYIRRHSEQAEEIWRYVTRYLASP